MVFPCEGSNGGMAFMSSAENGAQKMREELARMVNEQFETPEIKHFLSVPLTMVRARFYF